MVGPIRQLKPFYACKGHHHEELEPFSGIALCCRKLYTTLYATLAVRVASCDTTGLKQRQGEMVCSILALVGYQRPPLHHRGPERLYHRLRCGALETSRR